ncbi:MAG: hypothetical protein AAGF31_00805 [Planctomycetota bacterium]
MLNRSAIAAVLALALQLANFATAVEIVATPEPDRPSPGITARCKVIEVYDGDTLTVEITQRVRVRLLDCWAPEVRTKDDAEKALGLLSKENLATLAEGKAGVIHVPTGHADRADDVLTFGRALGWVWIDEHAVSLSRQQVAAGMASTVKDGELGE